MYNITFTSLPVIIYGIFDQNLPAHLLMERPHLYKNNARNAALSPLQFLKWTFFGRVVILSCSFSLLLPSSLLILFPSFPCVLPSYYPACFDWCLVSSFIFPSYASLTSFFSSSITSPSSNPFFLPVVLILHFLVWCLPNNFSFSLFPSFPPSRPSTLFPFPPSFLLHVPPFLPPSCPSFSASPSSTSPFFPPYVFFFFFNSYFLLLSFFPSLPLPP